MPRRSSSSTSRTGTDELPVARRFSKKSEGPSGFLQSNIWPWVLVGIGSLAALVILATLFPGATEELVIASTAAALFFLLFAGCLIVGLGRRSAVVAFVATTILYGITAWTPLVGVKSVLVLAMLVAFFMFVLAGFNFLFVVEEVLYDIHRSLHIKGTFWNAIPTAVILGTTPLVYWLLPLAGLKWPTLSVAMPFVVLLLATAWIVRWRTGPHAMTLVNEAHFLSIGTITGAGLADIVALLGQVEGILPSIVAYLALLVTWIFVSVNTLQRAQYFMKGTDVLPWLALLFAAGFAVLAHVQFLYGTAGAPGLAAVSEVRVAYLVFGVWLGLAFFVVRGAWRFLRFVRDEKELGSNARRTAGRFARVMEEVMESPARGKRMGNRVLSALDRIIPGGKPKSGKPRRKK